MCPPSLCSQKLWDVETNVGKLFCRLPDTMSQDIIGDIKQTVIFQEHFCLYPMFCMWQTWASGTENIPPKTTFQSRVNASGSVCDISQHYTGLFVYFFKIWRYFKVVTQWGPEKGAVKLSGLNRNVQIEEEMKWNEWACHWFVWALLVLVIIRVSWWANAYFYDYYYY